MDGFTFFLPLTKADQEKRLVWGRAAVEEPDKSREIMDYTSAKPEFQKWSDGYAKATLGKSFGNVRAMHNPRHLAGKIAEIIYNDQAKAVDVCVKVLDPVDWQKVEEGGYTGFSIGGGYLKKWTDQPSGCTRYTPRIQEISFVDSPCIPSARIMEMQKQDGSTEEVRLRGVARSFAELLPPPTFGDLHKSGGAWRHLAAGAVGETAGSAAGSMIGGENIGSNIGGQLGGAAGSAIGSAFGPVGTFAGGTLGSLAGSAIGGAISGGKKKKPKVPDPDDDDDDMGKAGYSGMRGVTGIVRPPKKLRPGGSMFKIHPGIIRAAATGALHGAKIARRYAPHAALIGATLGGKAAFHASRRIGGRIADRMMEANVRRARIFEGMHGHWHKPGPPSSSRALVVHGASTHDFARRLSEKQMHHLLAGAGAAMIGGAGVGGATGYFGTRHASRRAERALTPRPRRIARKQELIDRLSKAAAPSVARRGARLAAEAAALGLGVGVGAAAANRFHAPEPKPWKHHLLYTATLGPAYGGYLAGRYTAGFRDRKPDTEVTKAEYEGSAADEREDRRGARRMGMTLAQYERTARDRREDAAGERRMGKAALGGYQQGYDDAENAAEGTELANSAFRTAGNLYGKLTGKKPAPGTQGAVEKVSFGAVAPTLRTIGRSLRAAPLKTTRQLGGAAVGLAGRAARRNPAATFAAGGLTGAALAPSGKREDEAQKSELVDLEQLRKNILLQDDNTVSQWRAARSDQWEPSHALDFSYHDPNDPHQVMAGMPAQAKGPMELAEPMGDMAKATSPEQRAKIHQTMHEFKHGQLHSFRAGVPKRKMPKVANRKQAIAIALNQARRMGKGEDPIFVAALTDRLEKASATRGKLAAPDEPGSYTHRKPGGGTALERLGIHPRQLANAAARTGAEYAMPHATLANHPAMHAAYSAMYNAGAGMAAGRAAGHLASTLHLTSPIAQHAAAELSATVERRMKNRTMESSLSHLSPKEREQRVAAAKARWRKEGHLDMEEYHDTLHRHASEALLGRENKMARVSQEAEHFWQNVHHAHEAYDTMKPHTEEGSHIMMEIPRSGGMLHNPSGIGLEHFSRFGRPKHKIYLMHPDEVGDWIKKHGKDAGVNKAAPYGVVEHWDELNEVSELTNEQLEKIFGSSLIAAGAKRLIGSRIGQAVGATAKDVGSRVASSRVGQAVGDTASDVGSRIAASPGGQKVADAASNLKGRIIGLTAHPAYQSTASALSSPMGRAGVNAAGAAAAGYGLGRMTGGSSKPDDDDDQ